VNSPTSAPFDRALLGHDSHAAALALLGARLVRGDGPERRVGRIVEVEAYVGLEDLASHAHRGRTRRNAVMFGPPGHTYVYLVYGMYYCLNVVTEAAGIPAALLVRAVEPLEGIEGMRRSRIEFSRARSARGTEETRARADREEARILALSATRLASGPGLVCAAFSIDRRDNGLDLCDSASPLYLAAGEPVAPGSAASGPRVGIGYAPEPWLSHAWRYWIAGSPAVSKADSSADVSR
jgi:DNA-3-methyladenine glycosylase